MNGLNEERIETQRDAIAYEERQEKRWMNGLNEERIETSTQYRQSN